MEACVVKKETHMIFTCYNYYCSSTTIPRQANTARLHNTYLSLSLSSFYVAD
jgi:hypothetical protein